MLDYKAFGGNVALKFDIKKAFDTIDWTFLLKVLNAFGINRTFCSWIMTILQSAKLSILVNGHPASFPLLFCFAEDALSRGIYYLVSSGQLQPMSGPRNCPPSTHVFYTDDIMVFLQRNKEKSQEFDGSFKLYGSESGATS